MASAPCPLWRADEKRIVEGPAHPRQRIADGRLRDAQNLGNGSGWLAVDGIEDLEQVEVHLRREPFSGGLGALGDSFCDCAGGAIIAVNHNLFQ